MRKLTLAFAVLTILASCGSMRSDRASYMANKAYIGMSLSEFLKKAGNDAQLESLDKVKTVYRIHDYKSGTQNIIATKLFYFDSQNKLYRIESVNRGRPTAPNDRNRGRNNNSNHSGRRR